MKGHKQAWIKVNAPVDASIKNLVKALNLFTKLQTIESCQGNGGGDAWVNFYYGENWGNSWKEIADFVLGNFGPRLTREVGDRVNICLRVTEMGLICGELYVRPKSIRKVTQVIKKLYLKGSPN